MEKTIIKQTTLRGLGEEYRLQAEALGEQIARRRKAFETAQFRMTAAQKEQYYYDLAMLRKQQHDAEVTARTLVYYYEHSKGKRFNPDGLVTFTLEVTPCRSPGEQNDPSAEKAG